MLGRKLLSLFTVVCLTLCLLPKTLNSTKVIASSDDFDCVYSAGAVDREHNLRHYGASEIILYTEEEATAAGIPAGFTGDVLQVVELNGATSKGVMLDFSSLQIPEYLIASISFRIYVGADNNPSNAYPEARIPTPGKVDMWCMRYSVNALTEQWIDIVLDESTYFQNFTISDLCTDGYLDTFELAIRHDVIGFKYYVDSIKVNLITCDTPPTITYNGEDSVSISQGQVLNFDVSAMASYNQPLDVEYVWEDESKLDDNGNPLAGEHVLTFKATDYFGNVSTLSINVTVTQPNLIAPEMSVPTEDIFVKIGTTPLIDVIATDDEDGEVEVVKTWSENALDARGRLTEGTHTLTLTATDSSNNTTTKIITFHVSENGDPCDVVVDEETLCKEEESEVESTPESEVESEKVSTPESEQESVKESEQENISEQESISESEKESDEVSEEESEEISEVESDEQSDDQESEESKNSQSSTSSAGCLGSIAVAPILSLLAFAGVVSLIKKRR